MSTDKKPKTKKLKKPGELLEKMHATKKVPYGLKKKIALYGDM